jgi:hypothetical protein
LGLERTMVMFKVNGRLIAEKFSRFTWEAYGPCPVFACYTLEFVLKLMEGHGKNLIQGSRKDPGLTKGFPTSANFESNLLEVIPIPNIHRIELVKYLCKMQQQQQHSVVYSFLSSGTCLSTCHGKR